MRRAFLVIVLLGTVVACSTDPYPLPADPPHAGQTSPTAVGDPVHAVVLYLTAHPTDRIELLGAEAIGSLDGASVTFRLSRPVLEANGDYVIGAQLEDLEGAVFTGGAETSGPGDTVGIVAELTAGRPGRFELSDVRLRYRIDDGSERTGEGIDVVWTVCADDPAPTACPEE